MRRSLLTSLLWLMACLPGDDRPPPGSLYVDAEPSAATHAGLTTEDGWQLRFDRFVIALGDIRLHELEGVEGQCNDYSETRYEWLYDFAVAGREKVGLAHGLGRCSIEYSHRTPSSDSVLGTGASQADLDRMILTASDAYAESERVSTWVVGSASRDGVEKRFDWSFRRRYELDECPNLEGDGFVSYVTFEAEREATLTLRVAAEELFRDAVGDEGAFVFGPLADADVDGDGAITFEELDAAPVDAVVGPWDEPSPATRDRGAPVTLLERIYVWLLPRVTRVAGGAACNAELERWR
ncbi:MAG: hypothetical protein R3B72_10800 [Polyangiaceae bacterium]